MQEIRVTIGEGVHSKDLWPNPLVLISENIEMLGWQSDGNLGDIPTLFPNETDALLKLKRPFKSNFDFLLSILMGLTPINYLKEVVTLVGVIYPPGVTFDGQIAMVPTPVVLYQIIYHWRALIYDL